MSIKKQWNKAKKRRLEINQREEEDSIRQWNEKRKKEGNFVYIIGLDEDYAELQRINKWLTALANKLPRIIQNKAVELADPASTETTWPYTFNQTVSPRSGNTDWFYKDLEKLDGISRLNDTCAKHNFNLTVSLSGKSYGETLLVTVNPDDSTDYHSSSRRIKIA